MRGAKQPPDHPKGEKDPSKSGSRSHSGADNRNERKANLEKKGRTYVGYPERQKKDF